ncbi:hypothetical protein AZH53_05515 [Methanomicrobiaceae archaeon CYW5]|uniref:methionyl-tRNA formyltransferase n=1 Tax=Methanovulcanius yangii TaxID=1789227 RepID=UPI0029CA1028|nr:formyltransferase family protein [Methanovulcanius yangii]MBT8507870.1 hypothetical protein [Methanovulcanius yangii]
MKLLLCLNTKKGYSILDSIISQKKNEIIGSVISYTQRFEEVDYGFKIQELCEKNNIDYLDWHETKQNLDDIIETREISGIIAIGWQYLIPMSLNNFLPDKIVIFHDSLLPKYRGFSPLANAIIRGDSKTGLTVLYAAEKVDAGDILLQKEMKIDNSSYISDLIDIMSEIYIEAFFEFLSLVEKSKLAPIPQDNDHATYGIWRNPEDNLIDWNGSANTIRNLIRASGLPYSGAYSFLSGKLIRIWRCEVLNYDLFFEVRDSGKIWQIEDGFPIIICGQGLLKVTSASYNDGSDALPIRKVRQRFESK